MHDQPPSVLFGLLTSGCCAAQMLQELATKMSNSVFPELWAAKP